MGKIRLTALAAELKGDFDLLVCSASFEERCVSIARNIPRERVGKAIVFHAGSDSSAAVGHLRELRRLLRPASVVACELGRPLVFADEARRVLNRHIQNGSARVLVDITTFTHEHLLIILRILRDLVAKSGGELTLVYAAAKDYTVSGGDWLSRGYGDVRSVLGYPGELRPSRAEHLIVMFGFESARAERLIRLYEPARLSLGRCAEKAAIAPNLHERNVDLYTTVAAMRTQFEPFEFSCTSPFAARDSILKQAALMPGFNTVVAPMNTKLSTVGAALASFVSPSIQLCYLPAAEYNETGYSTPGNHGYVYTIDVAEHGAIA